MVLTNQENKIYSFKDLKYFNLHFFKFMQQRNDSPFSSPLLQKYFRIKGHSQLFEYFRVLLLQDNFCFLINYSWSDLDFAIFSLGHPVSPRRTSSLSFTIKMKIFADIWLNHAVLSSPFPCLPNNQPCPLSHAYCRLIVLTVLHIIFESNTLHIGVNYSNIVPGTMCQMVSLSSLGFMEHIIAFHCYILKLSQQKLQNNGGVGE